MNSTNPTLMQRIGLAFGTFFAILGNPELAARIARLRHGDADTAAPARPQPSRPATPLREATPDAALQLLGLLQRDARLIDFVEEDIAAYSDADVGAAARVVHEGCRKALREHFSLRPVREETEGARLTLPQGFDAAAVRLTGQVVGEAPFKGTLVHRGWQVTEVRLPKLAEGHKAAIIAPAEVEL